MVNRIGVRSDLCVVDRPSVRRRSGRRPPIVGSHKQHHNITTYNLPGATKRSSLPLFAWLQVSAVSIACLVTKLVTVVVACVRAYVARLLTNS